MSNSVVAIVPAAGQGTRMGKATPKQFLALGGIPLLVYSLRVLQHIESIREIILSVPVGDREYCSSTLLRQYDLEKVTQVVTGGLRRQDSVRNGVLAIEEPTDIILVHDGVRPFIDKGMVQRVLQSAREFGASVAAMPIHDTVKRVNDDRVILETLDRENLWHIQTPQAFRHDWLLSAHGKAQQENWDVTDDAALIERIGYPVSVVEGSFFNIKITKPQDLELGESILQTMEIQSGSRT